MDHEQPVKQMALAFGNGAHKLVRKQIRCPIAPNQMSLLTALLPAGIILAAVYVFPLARLVADSLMVNGHLSLAYYLRLAETPVFSSVLLRTLRMSALVTTLCVVLGYPLAYTLSRLQSRLAQVLLVIVIVPFFTSVLIRSYAWMVILSHNGLLNRLLMASGLTSSPVQLIHNELGAIIGMVQLQLPLMVLPLYSVMRTINRSLVLAAQSLGASPASAFWHVFMPLSAPGVAAGASLVFVTSLGFFVTPALLGGPNEYLIAQSIDARVSVLVDFGAASAQASVLLATVVALMLALRRPLGLSLQVSGQDYGLRIEKRRKTLRISHLVMTGLRWMRFWPMLETGGSRAIGQIARLVSAVRRPVLTLLSTLTLFYLASPMMVVVLLAFSDAPYLTFPPPGYSSRWFVSYLRSAAWMDATWFSLLVAAISASLATVLGAMAAFPLVRSHVRASSVIYVLYVSPLIVPHMVIAVALFFVMAPVGLVGSSVGFISAYTVLGLPYVIVVMTAALRRFDRSLEKAAASLGASPARVAVSVTLPLLRPALASAFLFAFLAAFDDLVVALFMSAPGAVTLPMRMWEDVRLEISPRIAAVSVLLLAATLLAMFITSLSRRDWATGKAWASRLEARR